MQRLWSFAELRFVHACARGMDASEIAGELNCRYHSGDGVRTAEDVLSLKNKKNIFSLERQKKNFEY